MNRPKRANGQCENEWWRIVGSGVRWGHTWSTKVLTFKKKKKKQMGRYICGEA